MSQIEYAAISNVTGPIAVVKGKFRAKYGEIAEIILPDGRELSAEVIESAKDYLLIQLFSEISGIDLKKTRMRLRGELVTLDVSPELLGRVFNGRGEPIDGGPEIFPRDSKVIYGLPINPIKRMLPRGMIETGVTSIDCLSPLILGQKLPIFSGSGLPHHRLVRQVIRQSRIAGRELNLVFCGIGMTGIEASKYLGSFEETGKIVDSVVFLSKVEESAVERMIATRLALTCAEYLAFQEKKDVLIIISDMSNYCEALREVSSARREVPGRMGYPGYLFSDLASIYERAGLLKNGSITMMPVLTMPYDDITHPIPDTTGYITEGQIVLSRDLDNQRIYPPVDISTSLSRFIHNSGAREDHLEVANQLYHSYSKVQTIRRLLMIAGEKALSEKDRRYLDFGRRFEDEFISQGKNERRTIEKSLGIAWNIMAGLPEDELLRIRPKIREKYGVGK